jgi:4-amino-4-deoxy-L-arabinose transferase-like glycosyltransferase
LFGISAIALQYLAGRQLAGRLAGIAAALFLLGVPQFVAYSRLAMMDVPLTALGMMSFVLLLYGERKRGATVLASIPFGLAILTKSVAAFLFLPGLLALALALHGLGFFRCREAILTAALALIIALPWHIWAALTYGRSFLGPYFFFHVLRRFAQPLEGHEGGVFYYFDLYPHSAGWLALIHAAGIVLIGAMAIHQRNSRLAAMVTLPIGAFLIVNLQGTKIAWYITPVYPGATLAAALALAMLFRTTRAWAIAILLGIILAVPGITDGRGSFVDTYNILDFSPEVRSLQNTPAFLNRVPLLYTLDVADPAPRFYLADRVEAIDQQGLERLIAKREPFLCLAFKEKADEYLHNHSRAKLKIAASTESLAMIEYR